MEPRVLYSPRKQWVSLLRSSYAAHHSLLGRVIRDAHILLIQHRHHASGHSYWLLPGGGLEGDETPEGCVQREVREETHLHVEVGQHLLDDPDYARWNLPAPAHLPVPRD